eukprot:388893-Rhodomonas_salina.1
MSGTGCTGTAARLLWPVLNLASCYQVAIETAKAGSGQVDSAICLRDRWAMSGTEIRKVTPICP